MGFWEDSWDGLKRGYDSGVSWVTPRDTYLKVDNPSEITVLDQYDLSTDGDNDWYDFNIKCNSRHIYSVGTSEKNVSGPLTLYRNDIMVGLRSTDTTGTFEGDYNYNPNHSAYYSVDYISPEGKRKNIVRRGIIYGGDGNSTTYATIYPARAGTYRVTINSVLTAGSCKVPSRQKSNFYSYEIEVVPPKDDSEIPFGVDPEDITALRDAYQQQQQSAANQSEVEETSWAKFIGIIGVISVATFVLLGGTKTDDDL